MSTDLNKLENTLKGALHSIGASDLSGTLKRVLRRFEVNLPIATDADGAITEVAICRVPVACKVVSAHITCTSAGITAHATNYATFDVSKRDGAGGAAAVAATFATDTVTTDDVTQWVPKALTVTAANASLTAGSVLTFKGTASGSGVAVPTSVLTVTLEEA